MNYKRHTTPSASKWGRCGATGKVIFRTEGGAKKRIKEILSEETNRCNGYLRAFQCHRCGFWHVTSKPNERYYKVHQEPAEKPINGIKELETLAYENTQEGKHSPTQA
jgi:hypothetical protein